MSESAQVRLSGELLAVMRAGVSAALAHDARLVAPAHLLLGLLADPRVGPAIAALLPGETIVEAAGEAAEKSSAAAESLAFRSSDGARTLALDAGAYRVFFEGARRAERLYLPRHLVYGFTAEAVKDRDLLRLFGADPHAVARAVDAL